MIRLFRFLYALIKYVLKGDSVSSDKYNNRLDEFLPIIEERLSTTAELIKVIKRIA